MHPLLVSATSRRAKRRELENTQGLVCRRPALHPAGGRLHTPSVVPLLPYELHAKQVWSEAELLVASFPQALGSLESPSSSLAAALLSFRHAPFLRCVAVALWWSLGVPPRFAQFPGSTPTTPERAGGGRGHEDRAAEQAARRRAGVQQCTGAASERPCLQTRRGCVRARERRCWHFASFCGRQGRQASSGVCAHVTMPGNLVRAAKGHGFPFSTGSETLIDPELWDGGGRALRAASTLCLVPQPCFASTPASPPPAPAAEPFGKASSHRPARSASQPVPHLCTSYGS